MYEIRLEGIFKGIFYHKNKNNKNEITFLWGDRDRDFEKKAIHIRNEWIGKNWIGMIIIWKELIGEN